MARPPKWRHVEFIPDITYFKPAGVPLRQLDEVVLTVEEPALRSLKHWLRAKQFGSKVGHTNLSGL